MARAAAKRCGGAGRALRAAGALADAVLLLDYLFRAGAAPPCLAACDANGDGAVVGSVSDAVYLIQFGVRRGPSPPAPFPECGAGTPADALIGCEVPPAACP